MKMRPNGPLASHHLLTKVTNVYNMLFFYRVSVTEVSGLMLKRDHFEKKSGPATCHSRARRHAPPPLSLCSCFSPPPSDNKIKSIKGSCWSHHSS